MLIFVPFYWFDQKMLFKQIQIFFRIYDFSNLLRKPNIMSISVLLSEIVTFGIKRYVYNELAQKCFKRTGKYNFAVCNSFCGERLFLLIIVPFYCFEQKVVHTKFKFFSGFSYFKLIKKNKFPEYFCAPF